MFLDTTDLVLIIKINNNNQTLTDFSVTQSIPEDGHGNNI